MGFAFIIDNSEFGMKTERLSLYGSNNSGGTEQEFYLFVTRNVIQNNSPEGDYLQYSHI